MHCMLKKSVDSTICDGFSLDTHQSGYNYVGEPVEVYMGEGEAV